MKKIIKTDGHGGAIDVPTVKSRAAPKKWIHLYKNLNN